MARTDKQRQKDALAQTPVSLDCPVGHALAWVICPSCVLARLATAKGLRDFVAQYAPSHMCNEEYAGTIEMDPSGEECSACRLVWDFDRAMEATT